MGLEMKRGSKWWYGRFRNWGRTLVCFSIVCAVFTAGDVLALPDLTYAGSMTTVVSHTDGGGLFEYTFMGGELMEDYVRGFGDGSVRVTGVGVLDVIDPEGWESSIDGDYISWKRIGDPWIMYATTVTFAYTSSLTGAEARERGGLVVGPVWDPQDWSPPEDEGDIVGFEYVEVLVPASSATPGTLFYGK
jgi:hypothetical protein